MIHGFRVFLQHNVDDIFKLNASKHFSRCLRILKHKFSKVKYAKPHLKCFTSNQIRFALLFHQISLSNLVSSVRQLYSETIHYKFHLFNRSITSLDLFNFVKVFCCLDHLDCSQIQTLLFFEIRVLIELLYLLFRLGDLLFPSLFIILTLFLFNQILLSLLLLLCDIAI